MRKLVGLLVALGVVVVLGYAALWWFIDPEAQRVALEERLATTFGRPATVGKLSISPMGGLSVTATDVRVERDPSFGEGTVFEVQRVRANLSLWDYIVTRKPVIESLVLENPRVTLVKREDGAWNWTTLGVGAQTAARPSVHVLAVAGLAVPAPETAILEHVEATAAEVVMINREAEPDVETVYKNIFLTADLTPSGDGYETVGRLTGDSAAAGGEPLAVELPFRGTLTPPPGGGSWRAEGAIEPGRFETRNLRLEGVRSDVTLDESQTLALNKLHAELYGGTLEGTVRMGLAGAGNRFESDVALANVGLEGLLASRPDMAGKLTGRLSAKFQGAGDLGDLTYTLATLEGGGWMSIDDARLTTVNVMAEVAKRGNLSGMSFDEPGTHADRIEGEFRMSGGRAFVTNASVSNINGYANARYDSGWIDLNQPATVSLSGSVTLLPALLEKVRASGSMAQVLLSAVSSGQTVTVPIEIAGTLEQPTVGVRWTAVLAPFVPGAGLLPMFGIGQ